MDWTGTPWLVHTDGGMGWDGMGKGWDRDEKCLPFLALWYYFVGSLLVDRTGGTWLVHFERQNERTSRVKRRKGREWFVCFLII